MIPSLRLGVWETTRACNLGCRLCRAVRQLPVLTEALAAGVGALNGSRPRAGVFCYAT